MHRTKVMRALALGAALLVAASPALAQGKGNGGKGHAAQGAKGHKVPPGQAKKRVTTSHAVFTAKDVLAREGYKVVRVERSGSSEVIYFYRGNNGNGKGRGPLQKIVVRPSNDIVVFDAGPRPIISLISIRLGL